MGSGGVAGEGGTGTGGGNGRCGDGNHDPDEACDDGNVIDGDGCSADCSIAEGFDCEHPLDLNLLIGDAFDHTETLADSISNPSVGIGLCDQSEAVKVLRYQARKPGVLRYAIGSPDDGNVRLASRKECIAPASELSCTPHGVAHKATLDEGDTIYFLAGTRPGRDPTTVGINICFSAFRDLGDSCDFDFFPCGPDLWCDAGGGYRCAADSPPEIAGVSALRGGQSESDLILLVDGSDLNKNSFLADIQTFDSQDRPVNAFSGVGSDELPDRHEATFRWDRQRYSGSDFRAVKTFRNLFSAAPQVTRIRLRLTDANNGSSFETIDIAAQVVRNAGEDCDLEWSTDRCRGGLECMESEGFEVGLCENLVDLRLDACASAQVVRVGDMVSGVSSTRGLWTPPDWCWEPIASAEPPNSPDTAYRLVLDRAYERLTISTDHPGTEFSRTILSLYENCGATDAPIACNALSEAPQSSMDSATIDITNVESGDYLIVVDSWYREAFPFELSVVAH